MRRSSLVAGLGFAALVAALAAPSRAGQTVDARQQFAAANALYAQQRYAEAAAGYEAALAADPALAEAHFFLGNAYDNLYRPARRGDPANDRLLDAACANYRLAADRLTDQTPEAQLLRKRTLQFLAAVYGRDKLDRPDDAAAAVRQLIALEPGDTTKQAEYLARGHDAIDQALALRPDYVEALVYKNLLLRHQARFERDPDTQARLLREADQLQRRAIEIRNARPPAVTRPGPP